MKIKITRAKVQDLTAFFKNPMNTFGKVNRHFAYALMKSVSALERENKFTENLRNDFEKSRVALLDIYAEKDEAGTHKLVQKPGEDVWVYEFTDENRTKFDKEFHELIEESGINSMMNDEVEVEVYPIKLEHLPEDLTFEQMSSLELLLETENEKLQTP